MDSQKKYIIDYIGSLCLIAFLITTTIAIIFATVVGICKAKVEVDSLRVQAEKSPLYTGIVVWTPGEWVEFQRMVDQQIVDDSAFAVTRKQADGQKFLFIVRKR